jgi:hypothetical protein
MLNCEKKNAWPVRYRRMSALLDTTASGGKGTQTFWIPEIGLTEPTLGSNV